MPLVASCPKCQAKYKLNDTSVGRKMRCRRCEKPFTVSAYDEHVSVQADTGAARPTRPQSQKRNSASSAETAVVACADCGTRFQAEFQKRAHETPCLTCSQPVLVPGWDGSLQLPRKRSSDTADKKKKQAAASASQPPKFIVPLAIGGVVVGGIVSLVFLLFMPSSDSGSSGIEPPDEWGVYEDDVGRDFKVDYPLGWEVKAGGRGTSNPWARFINGSVTIRVKTTTGGSIIGDIMGHGQDESEKRDDETAVAQVHKMMEEQYAGDFSDYEEQPARTIETKMGDGRFAYFTASGSWGSTLKGIRVTCLTNKYQYTVLCDCKESDWDVCRPIFERVAKSLSN